MISSKQRGITRVIETGCMPGLLLPDHVSTCGGIADLRRLKPPLCIKGGIFMQKNSLTVYIEAGVIATLAFIISLFPIEGTGFDIALGSIPITLFCLRRGWKAGIFTGLLWGLLTIILGGASIIHPIQVVLDYPVAFAFNGLAGIVAPALQQATASGNQKKATYYIFLSTFIGTLARYFWHFITGVYYWGRFAPEGWSVGFYSFVFNGGSVIVTTVIAGLALLLLYRQARHLFVGELA